MISIRQGGKRKAAGRTRGQGAAIGRVDPSSLRPHFHLYRQLVCRATSRVCLSLSPGTVPRLPGTRVCADRALSRLDGRWITLIRTEENQSPHPRRVDRRVRQQQPRVFNRQPVLDPNVARDPERQRGRRRQGELEDGDARFGQGLDVKVGLLRSSATIN